MVPASAAILALLALKLLDKERRSPIDDFNFDEALGLFAGLNVLPKKSFATDFSYRAAPDRQRRLLAAWVRRLAPVLMPGAGSFALDFHPIPYRGDEAVLENHYIPGRGMAQASVQSFFAQEHDSRVLCYANANLTRDEQPGEVLRFVEFWHDLTGHDPQWMYFDSKPTTYAELSRLNRRDVHFVTIRCRGTRLVQAILRRPPSDWTAAAIDITKRRQKRVRYLEQPVRLRDYEGEARQIAVTGLGREEPTLFLTNHFEARPRELIMNYARRNRIEDGLGTSMDFFHMDSLSSEVRLNVDLDVTLTVIAHGCYRWLAGRLKGFERRSRSSCIASSRRRAGRSRWQRTGRCGCGSTGAGTTRSCTQPPSTATARRSPGWVVTGSSSSIGDRRDYRPGGFQKCQSISLRGNRR